MAYSWKHKNWPTFQYDTSNIIGIALEFTKYAGEMSGILQGLTSIDQQDALIRSMITEALKTSEIEGELLNRDDVMSSIKNNLGLNRIHEKVKDKKANAISELMVDVRNSYQDKLSEKLIKQWHKLLFSRSKTIHAGQWRKGTEPMQVISGGYGKEIVHFEAPPSIRVPAEIKQFITWYNTYKVNGNAVDAIAKTAIAHLYFEIIHPFEDGNGRIGRAIAEKSLSQSLGRPVLLSLSKVIERNKKEYYASLKQFSGTLNINGWIIYFANIILQAQKEAVDTVQFSLRKTLFFDQYKNELNIREQKAIKKMLDAGVDGFEGGMTAKKYISINKTSKATATRDLQHLAELGALAAKGSGRSVYYELTI